MKTATRISEMQRFHFGRKIGCSDGEAGSLAYVVFDDTSRRLTHLGLKQGHLFSKTFNLPYDTVVEATGEALPPYRPDAELQQEIEDILFDLTPLHIDLKGITIRVLDSVLYLNGNISSQLRADIVQNQVMGVPGLLEINNNLSGIQNSSCP